MQPKFLILDLILEHSGKRVGNDIETNQNKTKAKEKKREMNGTKTAQEQTGRQANE